MEPSATFPAWAIALLVVAIVALMALAVATLVTTRRRQNALQGMF